MIALHAAWVLAPGANRPQAFETPLDARDYGLFVWGERLDEAITDSHEAPTAVPPHPRLLGANELSSLLQEPGLGEGHLLSYYVLLPTRGRSPIPWYPSTKAEAETAAVLEASVAQTAQGEGRNPPSGSPAETSLPTLALWEVRGFFFQGPAALEVLERFRVGLPPGVVAAPDYDFCIQAAKTAAAILREGKYLPDAAFTDAAFDVSDARRILSYWSIAWEDSIVKHGVQYLTEAVPPALLGYLHLGHDPVAGHFLEPVFESATDLVKSFLAGLVHQSVVTWLDSAARSDRPEDFRPGQKMDQSRLSDVWLRGLTGGTFDMAVTESEAVSFVQSIKEWRRPMDEAETWGLSLLAEPVKGDTTEDIPVTAVRWWRLDLCLENRRDRSILIPASWIFPMPGAEIKGLPPGSKTRPLPPDAESLFLTAVYQGTRVFPRLEELLESEGRTSLIVTTEELASLLETPEDILVEVGLSIRLPEQLVKPKQPYLRGKMKANSASGLFGLDALVDFDWTVAVEGQEIPPEEFARLSRARLPVIWVRDRFVLVSEAGAQRVINQWRTQQDKPLTLADVVRRAAEETSEANEPEPELELDDWVAQFMPGIAGEAQFTLMPQPESFQGIMRPYQVRGYSWLRFLSERGIGACLADDMGLGKTIQVIALLLSYAELPAAERKPSLIVCPTSVVGNWKREFARFAPSLRVLVHHGADRMQVEIQGTVRDFDVVLTTYGVALRDRKFLKEIAWQGVILDEAQNIKNPATKQARALRELSARYRIALTGTPVENSLVELWSIMHFLNPGYLGSLKEFRERFVRAVEREKDKEAAVRLRRLIRPFVLRRLKTDPDIVPDLPDKMEMKVYCGLTAEQAQLYQAVVDDLVAKLANEEITPMQRRGLMLAYLTRLKQIVDHPALFLKDPRLLRRNSGKLVRLVEMLAEAMAEREKSLVFTQYATMGEYLKRYLEAHFGVDIPFLHGAVPQEKRMEMVERFQNTPWLETPVFILSLKAGGTGLNLTAATQVFHFDRWWNPAVENQATDRAFRLGQTRKVNVYKFICGGTLEERIDQLIDSKRELAENVIGSGEMWLTELSNEEFRELVKLQAADIID